ncbi:hypothetical protein H4Q26_002361 [Puccinia striiformis f. sp. tritici PST-130]|uniref:Secreted protein n=1 Tax=Puccinia striiformis f. sp. tritici PST-78 TaxID=1165861 RepID=A0A0L0W2B3_9BASI|nr:hypothetical protein H4Q26_002361 [Puccinia striiformis f. sp. tritici PST-130]KNF05612.1 hypothetical protein PSTG_01421 [Puccinia striiformis f. sp. tritici PST-78]
MLFSVLTVLLMIQGRSVIGNLFECPNPDRALALCSNPPDDDEDTTYVVKPYHIGAHYSCPPNLDAQTLNCCKTDYKIGIRRPGTATRISTDTYSDVCSPGVDSPDPPTVDLTDAYRYYPDGNGYLYVDANAGSFHCPITCESFKRKCFWLVVLNHQHHATNVLADNVPNGYIDAIGCTASDDVPGAEKTNETCSRMYGPDGAAHKSDY